MLLVSSRPVRLHNAYHGACIMSGLLRFSRLRFSHYVCRFFALMLPWMMAVSSLSVSGGPVYAAAQIERVISPGGVEAWLISDPSVPVISVDFMFVGGASLDPEGKEGLASLSASLLNEGAGDYDSQAFLGRLADQSITMNFRAGADSFGGTLKTLARNGDEAFELLGLALHAPRFDTEAVERMRSELIAGLQQAARNPNQIVSKAWRQAAFGGHPYAQSAQGNQDDLGQIAIADLKKFAKEHLTRSRLIIGVCGDVTPEQLAVYLDKAFGALEVGEPPPVIPETTVQSQGVVVIDQDIPQSIVLFGHGGPKRSHPDYFAVRLVNYILGGGGLTSRLVDEVREKRGLAYSIHTYLNPLRQAGLISGRFGTQNDLAHQALDVVRAEWDRLARHGISAGELADAQTYMTGAFPLNMTTTSSIASLLTALQYHDLGIDYLERRNDLINAVTLEQANRVAAEFFDSDQLLITIIGRPKDIEATLPAPG